MLAAICLAEGYDSGTRHHQTDDGYDMGTPDSTSHYNG